MATTVLLVPKSMPMDKSLDGGMGTSGTGVKGRTVYTPRLSEPSEIARERSFPSGTATLVLWTGR
jgi:hypothetical protein